MKVSQTVLIEGKGEQELEKDRRDESEERKRKVVKRRYVHTYRWESERRGKKVKMRDETN